jgi:hypothetical protein
LYSLVYIFFRLSKTLFQNKLEICFYSFNLSKNNYHQQCW